MDALIIADDLSGAADCAAATGRPSLIAFGPVADATLPIVAVDLDSRGQTPDTARDRARQVTLAMRRPEAQLVYQKMDSTLRGQWAAELIGMRTGMAVGSARPPLAIVSPALPEKGRTLRHGRLYLDDVEAGDAAQLLREAGLRCAVVATGDARRGVEAALAADVDAVLCDAADRADLDAIADAALGLGHRALWVGSSGLMGSLARRLGWLDGPPRPLPDFAIAGPVLIVVGSASPVSRRQFERLRHEPDLLALTLPINGFAHHDRAVAEALAAGRHVAVALAEDAGDGSRLAAALGAFVGPHVAGAGGLVLTGGETARAVLTAAGVNAIRLAGEIEPGVPLGLTQGAIELPVITKSGAFGTTETLRHCLATLTVARTPSQQGSLA